MLPGGLARAGIALAVLAPAAASQIAPPARWVGAPSATVRAATSIEALRHPLGAASGFSPRSERVAAEHGPWWAPLASALVPGSGQALQQQRRAIAYFAADAILLAQYAHAVRSGRTQRSEYRRLARIARAFYTDRFPVGDFEYYERMEQFVESGAFDLNPGGDLEPETDSTTFNGQTWRLARETYWEDPSTRPDPESEEYQRALGFYARRAVTPEFQWSWRNAQLEQDVFSQTIQRSNAAFRLSSEYLGMLIANHALSAVDAFIVLRLGRGVSPGQRYRLSAALPWAPLGRSAGRRR